MTVARTDAARVSVAPRLARVFLGFFCFVLAGYAIVGRDFAHLGVPPIYIGEIALALGMVAALTAGNLTSAILNLPGLALALLMLWTALRTVPYWNGYEFDSVRDAMIVFYGLFAYVVASLILQRPVTLMLLLERYKRFIPFMIFLSPILTILGPLEVGGQPLFGSKVGDLSCHLTAILAFALIGFVRLRPLIVIFILLVELFAFTQGREAMLVFMVGCSLASIFSPDRKALGRLAALIGAAAAVMCVLAALDFKFARDGSARVISVRQLVLNTTSIFTHAGSEQVQDTKEWRLNWWSDIIDYTVHGRYFWSGKGFGPNLADTDGYQTNNAEAGEPPLRSPHNAHMTILARGGVPALVLWIGALGSWVVAVMRQLIEAKKLRDQWWVGVFAFLLTYWTMMVIASSFDVALEGPMLGIWFWTIHGIGMAALVLHRHRVAAWQHGRLRTNAGMAQ
jgi:hypothetical protein